MTYLARLALLCFVLLAGTRLHAGDASDWESLRISLSPVGARLAMAVPATASSEFPRRRFYDAVNIYDPLFDETAILNRHYDYRTWQFWKGVQGTLQVTVTLERGRPWEAGPDSVKTLQQWKTITEKRLAEEFGRFVLAKPGHDVPGDGDWFCYGVDTTDPEYLAYNPRPDRHYCLHTVADDVALVVGFSFTANTGDIYHAGASMPEWRSSLNDVMRKIIASLRYEQPARQ